MDYKEVIEILFLPDWGTHAYICKDGCIYIQLKLGKCFNKEKFLNDPLSEIDQNGIYKKNVLKLFAQLDEYYLVKLYKEDATDGKPMAY